MKTSFQSLLSVFIKHWLFFLILACAVLIRTYHIRTDTIFIGDQGRDFLAAKDILISHKLPLLGIPSSLPRFRQGPLYIYFLSIVFLVSSNSAQAAGLSAALLGILAIVGVYLLCKEEGKVLATASAFFVSISSMAILHSRMPFVINPIPLLTVLYFHQLLRLSQHKRWSLFGVGIAFGLLFQCELAIFPLLLLIPYVMLRAKIKLFPNGFISFFGLIIALSPKVLYDFSHHFSQLGGFLVWVLYRVATLLIPHIRHHGTGAPLIQIVTTVGQYLASIFTSSTNSAVIFLWFILLFLSLVFALKTVRQNVSTVSLSLASFLLMLVAFFIHSAPSEAYFPILIIPIAILIGHLIASVTQVWRIVLVCLMVVLSFVSIRYLISQHFFLLEAGESANPIRRFGPSLAMQQKMIAAIQTTAGFSCTILHSQERNQTFPTLIDNFEYLHSLQPRQNPPCIDFWIDQKSIEQQYQHQPGFVIDFGSYVISSFQTYVSYR